jgi:hypothetical protein
MILRKSLLLTLFFIVASSGCSVAPETGEVSVWIDVPVKGLQVEPGNPIQIEGHTTGASRVEIWVDGGVLSDLPIGSGDGELQAFQETWTPSSPGEHVIQAVALSEDGTLDASDSTFIIVQEMKQDHTDTPTPALTPTPTTSPTPSLTSTPTEPPPEQVQVSFWADPPQINAGACSLLRWQVENAQSVVLGSTNVSDVGELRVCLCETAYYNLVVTDLQGQEHTRQVAIEVLGECNTPTPTPTSTPDVDTTPPAAPGSLHPNGSSLGCVANVNISWSAVSDPSGIDEYQVDAFRHPGDNNWSVAPGSVWMGISGTGMSMPVECGWTYQWRVRAIDGAGNTGPFSYWATFVVPLQ